MFWDDKDNEHAEESDQGSDSGDQPESPDPVDDYIEEISKGDDEGKGDRES